MTETTSSTEALTENPGGTAFFNAPRREVCEHGQVALLGVPSDALVTARAGTSGGPDALRLASDAVGMYNVCRDRTFRRGAEAGVVDLGNLRTNRFTPETTLSRVYQAARGIFQKGARPLLVGGDHALTYSSVRAAAELYPEMYLLHIDAHFDATDPAQRECSINHGTYIRNLIENDILRGNQILQLGMRGYQWCATGPQFVHEHDVWRMEMQAFEKQGIDPFLRQLHRTDKAPLYVSLDIDSVDPAFAPGTGEHMPGGFSSREIIRIVNEVFSGSFNIIGADLVELNPDCDPEGTTCSLAGVLLAEMVDGMIEPYDTDKHS